MSLTNLDSRQKLLTDLLPEAGAIAWKYYHDPDLATSSKGLQDIVTLADTAVEDFLIDRIRSAFAEDGFVGEERGVQVARDADQSYWVIDPIDGTANFARHLPTWCLSVALVSAGVVELGGILHPVSGELFLARRGQGATLNGRSIHVSAQTEPSQAITAVGFSYRRPPEAHAQEVTALLTNHSEYRRLGSAAMSLAYVASGRLEAFWENHINSWDVLAGVCLVREAGGWTSDFLANDGLFKGNALLACAPGLLPFYHRLFGVQ